MFFNGVAVLNRPRHAVFFLFLSRAGISFNRRS
ncbi:MAG: hypothetical protein ACJAU6_002362 [Alphaproteobacteria bacterium]|jgi:hypothetical protein